MGLVGDIHWIIGLQAIAFGDILDKLDKTAGVNSRELWIATTQTQ